jgi:hypothetical protein
LTEIKGGVEVATHALHERATTLLGRAVDLVHIPLHHESISRRHARIAFDVQGIPWLRDLQSAHGVTVNKRRLPPEARVGKTEAVVDDALPGARGVMLFPGDVIQFGASTRMYAVDGPADFERGALQAKMQQQKLQRRRQHQQQTPQEASPTPGGLEEGASSWGISMSDDENDGDNEEASTKDGAVNKTLPMDLQVPEKHRKSFEKLNNMKYKLSNLETEDSRIRRKGELTEGQEKQLQRNAEGEEALKKSISDLEETLFDKLYPDKATKPTRTKKHSTSVDDPSWEEEDDFFDRTKGNTNTRPSEDAEAESEASLISKWKRFFQEQSTRREKYLLQAENRVSALQEKLSDLQANRDEDAFFVQNDLQLATESKTKIENEIRTVDASMDEVEKLLRIVNSKLEWDRATGYIGQGPPPPAPPSGDSSATSNAMPPPPLPMQKTQVPRMQAPALPDQRKGHPASEIMPPPSAPLGTSNDASKTFEMPAPKRQRVIGPSVTLPSAPSSSSSSSISPGPAAVPEPGRQKQHQHKRPVGTLSFLNALSASDPKKNEITAVQSASKTIAASKIPSNPKEDVWQAPKDQDGSGRTKLNDKFAGRY